MSHLLFMIESHASIQTRDGYLWAGGAALGTPEDWAEIKRIVAVSVAEGKTE